MAKVSSEIELYSDLGAVTMKTGRRASVLFSAASCAALAACLAFPALAQPPASAAAAADKPAADVQSFDAAYFKTYNPVTAADMVTRVPGFEIRDGDDRRGFGATAGNILINGERPSSKTLASEQLKRIPAGMVIRVDLVSGGASAESSGQAQIVNVILSKAVAKNSPTTFVAALRHIQYSGRIGWTLQASRSIALGDNAELAFDFQAPNLLGRGESADVLRDASGALTGTRLVNGQPKNRGLQGAVGLKWRPGPRDAVNLNAQITPTWNSTHTYSLELTPTGALRTLLSGDSDYSDNYTGEVGGDWEHRFSPTFTTKLIGLFTVASVDQNDGFEIQNAPATFLTRTQARSTDGGERVARLTATWQALKGHTLEFGAEGAFNYRQTSLDIFNTPAGGVPVRVPLAVSNARVEEVRGEAFIADVWTVNPTLTIESGFTFEASRITQSGDQSKERRFSYPKPRITATWAPNPTNQVRASLVRDVAQLDFAEFSSTVDFVNAASTQGNPNLEPQKAWKARVEWQHRFGKRGALTLAGFHDEVQDVHDLVDIGGSDAYGNIGDGTRTGMEIKASAPLSFIGLPTAEVRFNGLVQQTEVTDPKTGRKRSFSIFPERQGGPPGSATLNAGDKDWAYVFTFRQELPAQKSAWGAAVVQWAGRSEYKRIEMLDYERSVPRLDFYVETTRIKPVTIRFNVNNIFSPSEARVRTFYQTDRSTGVVSRTETRKAKGGPEGTRSVGIQVSGRF